MKFRTIRYSAVVVSLLYGVIASAQQAASQDATVKVGSSPSQNSSLSAVPRLMKFSGTLLDSQNRPMAGPVGVTFAIYSQESGGAALWMETQNVHPDANGNYTVLLGAASKDGLPTEQFTSGEARWLGLQVENQTERPRVLLVSVPYALKAHDAETLGGLPASAFLPAASPGAAGGAAISPSTTAATGQASSATPLAPCAFNGSGTTNFIPIWTGACSQANSLFFQTGGKVGLSTTTPSFKLHVIDSSNAGLRVQTNTAGGLVASFGGNGAFQVDAPGVPGGRFTITSNGLVGLGTNAPGAMLDVTAPNVVNDPVAQFGNSFGSSNSILVHNKFCAFSACLPSALTTGTTTMFLSGGFNTFMPGTVPGDGGLRVTPNRSIFFGDSGHARMLIASNGNVGISLFGTAPQATLDVIGSTNNTIPVGRFFAELNQNILIGLANIEGPVPVFRVSSSGKVFADGGFQPNGADFAESFAVQGDRAHYEAGDLLAIDRGGKRRMTIAQEPYSHFVAGIYSTKPGLLGTPHSMSDPETEQEVPLAVVGVVPCKVSTENGAIAAGDLLVSSGTPGYAMKGTNRKRMLGAVVGKALEPLQSGKGKILVLVTLQ